MAAFHSSCFASATMAVALVAATAATPHSYRFSVINRVGRVFSMTLTPLFQSPASAGSRPKAVVQPTLGGQRVMSSDLNAAGVYDKPVGPSVPVSGATLTPQQTGPVAVSIHYN